MDGANPAWAQSLRRDPAVALPTPPRAWSDQAGPQHRVQFVIEFVGPRSVPASAARVLVQPQWHQALGKPEVFAMAPADRVWQPLGDANHGSYDSIALAWNFVSASGALSSLTAAHLLQVAENFGSQIQRRPMPLPPPADVDRTVAGLHDIQAGLDIGVEILIVPKSGEFAEPEVWEALAHLGFDLNQEGYFAITNDHEQSLLEVTPMGGATRFSLGAAQSGARHPGLLLGFSVPLSPDPNYSFDAAVRTAGYLGERLNAAAFSADDRPLSQSVNNELRMNLQSAVASLKTVGITPGSRVARILFE